MKASIHLVKWTLPLMLLLTASYQQLALAFSPPSFSYTRFAIPKNNHHRQRTSTRQPIPRQASISESSQDVNASIDPIENEVELNIVSDTTLDEVIEQPSPSSRRGISYRNLVPKARRPTIEGGSRYLSTDWILSLLSIPRSYLLRRIKTHVIFDQSVCLLVLLLHKSGRNVSIPLLGHTLLGSFLGLLLAFRTNSAYDRFWDARGYWSKTAAICRSLAIGCVWHLRPHAPKAIAKLEKLLVAFPDVLAYTCLLGVRKARLPLEEWELLYGEQENKEGKTNGAKVNGGASNTEEKEAKMIALDPATVILHKMNQCLHEASYETKNPPTIFNFYLSTMGGEISQLSDALSGCEKIVQTPVPLSYSRHTSRFLTMWCGFLPFAIVKDLGWLSMPVMGIISWLLYGLEEIGHLIEQPFVPVTDRPTYLIEDTEDEGQQNEDDRAANTMPYDIGLPVCSVAERIRSEVENIISLR